MMNEAARARTFRRFHLWRFPATREIALAALLFLYLPIVALVILSFSAGDSSLARWSGFSLRWYADVLGNDDMLRAIRNSLMVASVATVAGSGIATLAALATSGPRFSGQTSIEALIGLPLIVPDVVAGIAILLFLVMVGVPLGLVSIMLAHSVFAVPFAYLPIRARLTGLDPALVEAAADLYATPWLSFRRVVLPLIWPGIAAGAMLAFISSLGDVVVSYFVSGPGATTLPVYVFSMVRMGVTPSVNAVSTLLMLASIVLLAVSFLFGRRLQSRSGALGRSKP